MSEARYYDFDRMYEKAIVGNFTVEDMLYIKDLQQRKLVINSEIMQESTEDVVRHILQFNREDEGIPADQRKPILLYITSNGGEMDAGFAVIDAIRTSITPVYTINLSNQYSMGFLIGIAGHRRYAMPNAKFLMHDGTNCVYNSGAKARDEMKFQERVEQRIKDYVLSLTSITSEEYDEKLRVEWYMFADDAKKNGCTDYIVGVDCGVNEII